MILPALASSSPRVISLVPSATEILGVLGAVDLLVGRSHECDHPEGLGEIPVLTGQRVRSSTLAEIDAEVSGALRRGESLYTLDEAAIRNLRPDVILTQDVCEVCSIDLRTVERIAASLSPAPRVVSLNPATVEGVLDDVLAVAGAIGLENAGLRESVVLRERLCRAQDFVNPFADGPSVAFLEWTDPPYCAGHWTVQLIERAGGRHPLNPTKPQGNSGLAVGPQQAWRRAERSRRVSPEELAASAPEYVVVCPCGLGLERAAEAAAALQGRSWWNDLPAVRAGRVAVVDGNQMFNRPGPRLVDAFEWLVGWLNGRPELMPRGFPWRSVEG